MEYKRLSKLKTFNSRLLSPCEGTECFHLYVTLRVGPLLIVYSSITGDKKRREEKWES